MKRTDFPASPRIFSFESKPKSEGNWKYFKKISFSDQDYFQKKINWAFSFEEDFFLKGALSIPADAKLAHMFASIVFVLVDPKSGVLFFSPTSVHFTFMLWIKLEQFLTYVIANFSTMVQQMLDTTERKSTKLISILLTIIFIINSVIGTDQFSDVMSILKRLQVSNFETLVKIPVGRKQ